MNKKKNINKIEVVVVFLIGIIMLLMSVYLFNENIYIEGRDEIITGTIIEEDKMGHFIRVPVFIYKNPKGEFLFARGNNIGKFEVGEIHSLIYRDDKPKNIRILDDFKGRFFDSITLFIGSIIFFYSSFRFYYKGKI